MLKKDFEKLDGSVNRVPDFPKPGILFYDVTGILKNPESFKYCIDRMAEIYSNKNIDVVCGIESRGFVFAAALADRLSLPLVLIRKKGKLPGKTYSCAYSLEYGKAEIEVHIDDVKEGQNFLLVDDLSATGGTLKAACELVLKGGARVTDVFGVIGLPFLNFKKVLSGVEITTLIDYDSE